MQTRLKCADLLKLWTPNLKLCSCSYCDGKMNYWRFKSTLTGWKSNLYVGVRKIDHEDGTFRGATGKWGHKALRTSDGIMGFAFFFFRFRAESVGSAAISTESGEGNAAEGVGGKRRNVQTSPYSGEIGWEGENGCSQSFVAQLGDSQAECIGKGTNKHFKQLFCTSNDVPPICSFNIFFKKTLLILQTKLFEKNRLQKDWALGISQNWTLKKFSNFFTQ